MTVFSLALWLFGFYSPWPAVNARVLTECACDNNLMCGVRSIIGVVQLQWL